MRCCLALVFLCCCHLAAGFSADTIQIRILYNQALKLSEQKHWREAEPIAWQALRELNELKNRPADLETGLYNILGDCALGLSNYSEAIKSYEKSKVILEEKGLAGGLLMADALNKTGNYYLEIKDFNMAWNYLERALRIRKEILGDRHIQVADVYNNMGNYMFFTGDFDKALEFHKQALEIREAQAPNLDPKIAQSYHNIGTNLYYKGEKLYALINYRRAIKLYRELYGDVHLELADVYLNMGAAYGEVDEPKLYLEYNKKALDIYRKTLGDDHPSIALCYNNLANYYYDYLSDFKEAAQLRRRTLAIRIDNYGDIHPDVAKIYFLIGRDYYREGEWQKAMKAFDQCFKALNYQPGPKPVFDEVNNPILLLQLFESITEVHVNAYDKPENSNHLFQAFTYLEQADRLIDFLRIRYETTPAKLNLANTAHDIYERAIELAQDLYQLNKDEKYKLQSFLFSEKSKSILLLEALKKTDAEVFSGIPENRIAELNSLESTIGELEKRRFLELENRASSNDKAVDSLSTLIFEQKQLLSNLISDIERSYPQYYQLRYETATVSIDWIQKKLLKPGQTLLAYFLGERYLQVFVINKNDFQLVERPLPQEFYQGLDFFIASIKNFQSVSTKQSQDNISLYVKTAHYLFKTLIKPVEDMLEDQLIIIPDGELGVLPFDALLSSYPDDERSFKTHPYLLRDYTISYNYSATLLKEMTERKNKKRLKSYLGLAPVFKAGNIKGLLPLKYNHEEILSVQKTIGGQILAEQEATKRYFLARQADYKIIHLATHGKANHASGDYSFLAFSETADVVGNEALLYVKEIYNMSTNGRDGGLKRLRHRYWRVAERRGNCQHCPQLFLRRRQKFDGYSMEY